MYYIVIQFYFLQPRSDFGLARILTLHIINLFSELCCGSQFAKYRQYGYSNLRMTPDEYYNKLVDYSEHNKQLNYIRVRVVFLIILKLFVYQNQAANISLKPKIS